MARSDLALATSRWLLLLLTAALIPNAAFAKQPYTSNGDGQLAQLIEEALDRNPQVRESFSRYQAARLRVPQVSSLPDPMLGVTQYVRSPETRVGPQTTMLSLSQKFPWFGKLSDQGKIAAKQAAVLEERHEAQRAEIVRRVKIAYYELAYVDRALSIRDEDEDLLSHYETLAQSRYSQGVGLQQAVVKLQAELTRQRSMLQTLRRQRVDAEATLNALRDLPVETPIAAVTLDERPEVSIDLDELYATGRAARPELRAALFEIEANERRIQLARRDYRPDFTVGATWGNVNGRGDMAGLMNPPEDNGKDVYSVTVGVNIPIFRRKYDAGVQEATELFQATREQYRNTANSVDLSVRSIAFRLQTIEEQIELFETALLPQADQALQSSEAAYSTGTAGVLDLLDGERVLLEVRLGLARLRTDYMKALAEMERAIGAAFPEVQP